MAQSPRSEMSGRGGFIERWSKRKREREGEALPEAAEPLLPAPDADDPVVDIAPPEAEAAPDPELLASLPRIEEITATTDIRVFLQAGVPQALRNAALRAAWAADPVISDYRDPAVDYFWDWNAPGGVPGGGGGLVPERVAAMARSLLDQSAPVQDTEVGSEVPDEDRDRAAPDPGAVAESGAGPATPSSEPDRRPAEHQPQVASGAPRDEGQPEPAERPVPRRRHGGALPG